MSEQLARKISAAESLLDAAEALFSERGYEAVSTRDLAERAEVNLGAIQYHFGSKAKLFVSALHRMMQRSAGARALELLRNKEQDPQSAVVLLNEFVKTFLSELLHPSGPQACRIMFREVLSDGPESKELHAALISSVVEHFTGPLDQELQRLLKIISPEADSKSLQFFSQSIMGQCSFYFSHRPFLERLRGYQFADPKFINSISNHIVTFSLTGMGRSDLVPHVPKLF